MPTSSPRTSTAWTPSAPTFAPGSGERRAMRASGTETVPAAGQRSRRPWSIPVPGVLRAAEAIAFWLVTAPFLALLPARIGYRTACWRGDWTFRSDPGKRDEITSNLRLVLGAELGEQEAERMTREVFRHRNCWIIDVMR